ncbi:MAG: hypothetical protein HYY84_14905 [Deltaproteobacteria bacterium]|nr:hypothetical protein [Deltaproteobacteria bacterium]
MKHIAFVAALVIVALSASAVQATESDGGAAVRPPQTDWEKKEAARVARFVAECEKGKVDACFDSARAILYGSCVRPDAALAKSLMDRWKAQTAEKCKKGVTRRCVVLAWANYFSIPPIWKRGVGVC